MRPQAVLSRQSEANLVLFNARILTMDLARPRAEWVVVSEGRIREVGDGGGYRGHLGRGTRSIDCGGRTLLPGFHDAHCHILGLASRLMALDCGQDKAPSIAKIKDLVRRQAGDTTEGRWVRAFGYDEALLAEGRHPNRRDLDEAAPSHPVRLEHRTGHGVVLNSLAMSMLGIGRNTEDPPEGMIERDESGEPTGVFLEMSSYIGKLMAPYRRREEMEEGVRRVDGLLLSRGVTSVQDAGWENGLERWETLYDYKQRGLPTPRVTMMVGWRHAVEMEGMGLGPGVEAGGLRVGAAKFMLTLTTGALHPPMGELREAALDLHNRGWQLAFHAVEREAVEAAAEVIGYVQSRKLRPGARHRIEHVSECPPSTLAKVKASGAVVVTQPGFIWHNGDRYLRLVGREMLPNLYPLRSLTEEGIRWAASSDAPVIEPDPLLDIYAAVSRRTVGGGVVGERESVGVEEAVRAWTLGGSYVGLQDGLLGSVQVGKAG
ncbi:MAG: amidohydrolase, partial [SAR202 cluster bacterium]|nr:amidohydrolase [SAR202 cluster bacterium]